MRRWPLTFLPLYSTLRTCAKAEVPSFSSSFYSSPRYMTPIRSTRHISMSTSSQKFKMALCQMLVTGDKSTNLDKAASLLRLAKKEGAKLAVLPECFQCPYDTACFRAYAESVPSPPFAASRTHQSPSLSVLQDLARETGMYIVGGSIPEICEEKIFNSSMVVSPSGDLLAKHRKVHMFDVDVPGGIKFTESDALTAGDSITTFNIPELSLKVGIGICYDLRFPEMAMLQAGHMKASLLVYPGAFNLTTGPAHWELLIRSRAVDNQVFVAACSPARTTSGDGYKAWGHSMVADPWGKILATTDEKESVVIADIDMGRVENIRRAVPVSSQKRSDLYKIELLK